ncbi:MAG: hypothetical protein AAF085_14330, partial [Planctomycetota bacterium]
MPLLSVLLCWASIAVHAQDNQPAIELSPLVTALLEDDLLTDEQRREAMIFHGQWEELGELSDIENLLLQVAKQQVSSADLGELEVEELPKDPTRFKNLVLTYVEGLEYGGQSKRAASRAEEAYPDGFVDQAAPVARLRIVHAEALEDLGQYGEAIKALAPVRAWLQNDEAVFISAEELTAAAKSVLMLARLEGRPAADFHLANKLLSKARDEVDPLYWPAYVAEAELLFAKGNPQQAMEAIGQALSLNPKSSEAWYLFGSMRCRFFDFDAANRAVKELKAINNEHPLADVLAVEIALRQKDVATAQEVIEPALERYPTHRQLLAMNAAVQAMTYGEDAKHAALAAFAELAPGNPLAEHAVGQALSDARQSALAEPHLKNAIKMMPGWSQPQLTLGELYVQWGKLDEAAKQLQAAASLDPFHMEITNQLTLVQEMLGYDVIETDQFVVRYLPGVDEVLARDVALHMGDMVEQFIERFQHDPPALTQVDLMPDDQHFAVRITGMPSIWTIAACTGDVIALTPPRPGPKRAYGPYNWLNVMGHEYAHVVNLSQTNNRVPHWFTEGCAVNMETTGRLWSQYQLLAECYNNDKLFEYDEINWGFIRPTQPYHRSLAYAQSAWIKEYIETTFGWEKAILMLELYKQGKGEHETIQEVFGVDVESFMAGFTTWAGNELVDWGMSKYGVEREDPELATFLASDGPVDAQVALDLLAEYQADPDLLRKLAEARIAEGDMNAAITAIQDYQRARPVDPWADRQLARLALEADDSDTAIAALKTLDKVEGNTPEYA